MKTKLAYVFVDDGYPEASDYDNNFVGYDPGIRGDCERALAEVRLGLLSSASQVGLIRNA